jgi:phenylalanyl-tRNA synthetase beta chain
MKFSEAWLREWVNPEISTDALVEQLTMAGLEVDAVEPVAGDFSGVVVGEILAAEPHPDADKLRVCSVRGPEAEVYQVVCGAPNARVGIKIPFAMVGAKLPGDFKIKKAKLRGVESFGMLCAQTELQAGDDDDGLWELASDAPVGNDLREYLGLNDQIIEVDLTPNRSDCLGLRGIAREVGVLNRKGVNSINIQEVETDSSLSFEVKVSAKNACPLYFGRVIEGVNVGAATPLWMQERLRRSGIRSIDPVVDVTNYVLLELGQPMHAFDLEALSGGIDVRLAKADEKLTLLNEQELALQADSLVIADEKRALALAGVMGGASSAVTENTTNLFLEAAFFNPVAIAGRARHYGLHTDSSHRFERGVDFAATREALERATQLILDIAGGKAGPIVEAKSQQDLPENRSVVLRKMKIEKGLGFAIPDADVVEILERLGLTLQDTASDSWTFGVPSYRFDIAIEADLLEELARIYGYNRLPVKTPAIPQNLPTKSETELGFEALATQLIAHGYREVITYSFIDPKLQAHFAPDADVMELLNPISADMSAMRTSLIPGLLQTLISNVKRRHDRVRLFETGLRFTLNNTSELEQTEGFAALMYGNKSDVSWSQKAQRVDFYDLKGQLQSILSKCEGSFSFRAQNALGYLHPGQSAEVLKGEKVVGHIGALHPELCKQVGLKGEVFVFELDLDTVLAGQAPSYHAISRQPEVERDLAFVVSRDLPVANMYRALKTAGGEYLKELKVFDIYAGEGIDSQRKSVAFNLTFQHSSRTLNESEVNDIVETIVNQLEGEFDAVLRQ